MRVKLKLKTPSPLVSLHPKQNLGVRISDLVKVKSSLTCRMAYGVEQSASHPGLFNPRERACDTHGIGGGMGCTASQTILEKNLFAPGRNGMKFPQSL